MSGKRLLVPDLMLRSVLELTPTRLAALGLRALILDADNTLVPRNAYRLDAATDAWVRSLQAAEVKLCILSNSLRAQKVAAMVHEYGMPTLSLARKPALSGFRRALALLGTAPDETAMVGDQLFTDIVGGNRMGLLTVLVRPVSGNDFIVYRLLGRTLEGPLLARRWRDADRQAAAQDARDPR